MSALGAFIVLVLLVFALMGQGWAVGGLVGVAVFAWFVRSFGRVRS